MRLFRTMSLSFVLLVSVTVYGQVEKQTFTYSDTLQLDFYSEENNIDANRLLVLLVHGGGFYAGKRDNPLETEFCKAMALKGYAVASMSYRLTRKGKPSGFGCGCPASEKIETFVAASEDIADAVKFLQHKNKTLKFDADKFVLIGSSAGAEVVLNSAFMQDHYAFKHIPKIKPSGVVSMSGVVLDADYIIKENAIPSLFFHGKKDKIVPFATAPHIYCKPKDVGYIILDGSKTVAVKLDKLKTSNVLAYDEEGDHEWSNKSYAEVNLINWFIQEAVVEQKILKEEIILNDKPISRDY
ncbi:alpha/beta hydrolase fold domain-containing protein [Galbibacter sp. EGI 63066]|uniref:alpha/beta hydrolase n=1 Tax=Galbibacter sp. EGI 63066 TaxID=2993559 RepID=UPI002248B343|nr:alpha/beta hydrolase fold domain-containing protein [Galbibacter sp. EGI 63066]MCX2681708.1 alpha/beta hydrolase fold domain-containing protein [Galbibacter sp. EGI 63066]